MWQMRSPWPLGPSTLVRVDLPSGELTPVRRFPFEVRGLGYSATQDRTYGVGSAFGGVVRTPGHVLRLDSGGEPHDLGPIHNGRSVPDRHNGGSHEGHGHGFDVPARDEPGFDERSFDEHGFDGRSFDGHGDHEPSGEAGGAHGSSGDSSSADVSSVHRGGVHSGSARGSSVDVDRAYRPWGHEHWDHGAELDHPTAGAVSGNHWYLIQDGDLYTVDIDPAGGHYLDVVDVSPLRGSFRSLPRDVDVDPSDGTLRGVSETRSGAEVVSIDPATGHIRPVTRVSLPPAEYGSAQVGPNGSLYVTANNVDWRSRLYRVDRDGSATEVSDGAPLSGSDSAGCLARPRPPVASPVPPPQPAPVPPPVPAPPNPAPPPPVRMPPAPPKPPPPPPKPPQKHKRHWRSKPKERKKPNPEVHTTAEKRRWGMTVLLLTLGSASAARAVRRHR